MKYLVLGALITGGLLAQEVRYETLEIRSHWAPPEARLVQIATKPAHQQHHHKVKPTQVKHHPAKASKPVAARFA